MTADKAGRDFDIAVEVTGNPDGFEIARSLIRPRGTLVLKSTYADRISVDFSSIVVDEITLIGSRCGPFKPALELLANGKVDVAPIIEGHFPLKDGLKAFDLAAQPGAMKVLVEP